VNCEVRSAKKQFLRTRTFWTHTVTPKTITIQVVLFYALGCRIDWQRVSISLASHHSVVVYPGSTEDVSKIVKIAGKYKMPVTPYSGGTSLEGNFRAVSTFLVDGCVFVR
jgi:hypothetical protein